MNKESKAVFTVTETKDKKSIWNRVGTAFVNRDGSLNVLLNNLPLDGKLHIRDSKFPDKSNGHSRSDYER